MKPWELAGFDYKPHEIPTCWISWALQYERVQVAAKNQLMLEGQAQRAKDAGLGG